MNPLDSMGVMGGAEQGPNLLSILINIAFGFVAGLMIFLGPASVLAYGAKLAGELIKLTGYGQQMALFGLATTAAPYIILAPLGAVILKQLSSVRSLKSFAFFVAAIAIGVAGAYFGQSYFGALFLK